MFEKKNLNQKRAIRTYTKRYHPHTLHSEHFGSTHQAGSQTRKGSPKASQHRARHTSNAKKPLVPVLFVDFTSHTACARNEEVHIASVGKHDKQRATKERWAEWITSARARDAIVGWEVKRGACSVGQENNRFLAQRTGEYEDHRGPHR